MTPTITAMTTMNMSWMRTKTRTKTPPEGKRMTSRGEKMDSTVRKRRKDEEDEEDDEAKKEGEEKGKKKI